MKRKSIILWGLLVVLLGCLGNICHSPIKIVYAGQIEIASEYDGLDRSIKENCVFFVKYKINRSFPKNVTYLEAKKSLINSDKAIVGSVAITNYPDAGIYGHVAYVEAVNGNKVTTLNGGWSGDSDHIYRWTSTEIEQYIIGYWVPEGGATKKTVHDSVGNTSITINDSYTTANKVTLEWSKAENAKTYDCVLKNKTRNTSKTLDGLTGTERSLGKLEEGTYKVSLTPRNGDMSGKTATASFVVKFASGVPIQAANTVKTYDGNAYGITLKDKGEYPKETKITYAVNESGPYQSKAIKMSEVGQLRVYYKVENPHYASVKTGSQKIVINKVRPNIKIESYTGEYDGKAHTIELKGVPKKATIQYRASTLKKWSDEEISLTKPGKKTVYVKVSSPNYTKAWTGKGIIKITKNGKVSSASAEKTAKKNNKDTEEAAGADIQQSADGATVLGKGVYKIVFNKKNSGWMDIVAETNCKISHDINKEKVFQKTYGKGETIVQSLSQDAVTISVHSGKIKLVKAAGGGNDNLLYTVDEAEHDIFYGRVVKAGETLTVRNDNYSSDITKNKVTVYFSGDGVQGERTVTDNWWHQYMPSLNPEPKVNTYKDLPENGQGWQPYGNQTTVEYRITAGEFRVFVYWKDKDMISFMK